MANEVVLKIKVDDDGTLRAVGNEAAGAAEGIEQVGKSTDKTTNKKKQYNKVEKGVGQLTANTTKAFSKQNGVITSGIVPAYAILASNVFALTAAFNFLKRAFDVQALQDSQLAFAQSTGVALGSVTARLREASDGMLGFREAAEASSIGLAKGFSPQQLEDLAEGARKASTALGRDFQDAFDRLLRGASKAEPELLDELGITLRLEQATQRYADAIGKNRKELNEYERSQAVLIETQRQLNKNFGDVEAISNPFIVLSKTFEDLVKTVTGSVMPIFTAFADIINRNAMAAIAVFGAIGVSIIKTIIPADKISASFQKFFDKQDENVANAIADQEAYRASIEATDQAIRDSRKDAGKTAARGILKEGGPDAQKSAILQKLKKGVELSPQELGTLKKSLKKAEAEYKKTGQIASGMFKGVSIALVRDLAGGIKKTEVATVSLGRRITRVFKRAVLSAKVFGTQLKVLAAQGFKRLGGAAAKAGAVMNKALSLAGFIGIITMVIEMFNKLKENLGTITRTAIKGLDIALKFIGETLDEINLGTLTLVDSAINNFREMSNKVKIFFNSVAKAVLGNIDNLINGFMDGVNTLIGHLNTLLPKAKQLDELTFRSTLAESLGDPQLNTEVSNLAGGYEKMAISSGNYLATIAEQKGVFKFVDGIQASAEASRASKEALDSLQTQLEETKKGFPELIKGIDGATDAVERGEKVANAIQSLQVSGAVRKLGQERIVGEDAQGDPITELVLQGKEREEAIESIRNTFLGLGKVSKEVQVELNRSLDLGEPTARLITLENAAGNVTSGIAAFEAAVGPAGTAVAKALAGGDISAAIEALDSIDKSVDQIAEGFVVLGQSGADADIRERYEAIAKSLGTTTTALKTQLIAIDATDKSIQQREALLQFTSGAQKEALEARIALDKINLALQKQMLAVSAQSTDQGEKDAAMKARLLKIESDRLELAIHDSQFRTIAAAAGVLNTEVATQKIRNQNAESAIRVELLQKEIDKLKEKKQLEDGDQETIDQTQRAINIELITTAGRNASTALQGLSADFAALGPEGKPMADITSAASAMTASFTEAFAIISEKGIGSFEGIKAAAGAMGTAFVGISKMAKATSDMRVQAIDNEIAKEKERDGKSKESQAKIAQLEKKKLAEKKKGFEIEKKMKIAQTIMATAQAAMAVYGSLAPIPFVGPALAAAAAAAVVAMGAQQVAMIAATSFQGGGSVGGSSGPTSITAGQRKSSVDMASSQGARGELAYMRGERGIGGPENFTPAFSGYRMRAEGGNTALMVGEQGPELFVPNRPGRVVANDDIAAAGPTNVSFNINTIDASGVEDMLTVQRGNIIGMIREAANSYGEDFVESVDTSILTPTADRGASRY